MDIEKEIDHRIQLMGIHLSLNQDDLHDRIRHNIEIEEAERVYRENNQEPIRTFKLGL